VAHAITLLELGGAQQNTLHTVRHLDRRRFEVTLLAGRGGLLDDEARRIPDLGLHFVDDLVRPARPWRDLRALAALTALLGRLRPDILHTHSSKAGILGRLAARLSGVPVVVHSIHGFGFTPGQPAPVRAAFLAAERLVGPWTSHFVAVSRANVAQGIRTGLFERSRVTLVRSGIPVADFAGAPSTRAATRAAVRGELAVGAGETLVGSISCLKAQKDPLTFAEVAARVVAREPRARFALAGDGVLRPALEARLLRLGVAGRVRLLGWRHDVERLLAGFDLLLHTSRWEGLPRVLPQAMAAGLAVVATAVDGAPEAVRHGWNGLLAAPGDADALAAAVAELLADPDRRRRMGERGRARVGEFDVGHLVPAQEALYDRLLAATAAAG
jgi:glycosyltransferase involved in cell wall biosynthesis